MLNIGCGPCTTTRENNVYICSQLPVKSAQLPVAHAHTQGNPEGVTWPSVTGIHGRKNAGNGCATCGFACACDHFRTGPLPWPLPVTWLVTWLTSLPVKRPYYGGYCATSGCACAEHTSGMGAFGQGHFRSRDWRHCRSRDFREHHPLAPPPQIRLCPSPYTTANPSGFLVGFVLLDLYFSV